MKKQKINWWALLAVIVISVPVGYVATGVIEKMANKDKSAIEAPSKKDPAKVVENVPSVGDSINLDKEKEDTIAKGNGQTSQSDVVSEGKSGNEINNNSNDVPKEISVDNKEEPTPPKPTPKKLGVKPQNLTYAVNGGSKTIKISSNTDWHITIIGDDGWLKTNTTDGSGNKDINIVAQENNITSQRNAKIEVRWTDQNGDEKICQIVANQAAYVPVPEPLSVAEAQAIIASGKVDSRIPDNCKMVGNAVNTSYMQFRKNVVENKYESVKVESVSHDKKGNVSQVKVTVVRPKPPVPVPVDDPIPVPKPVVSKEEVQKIVASGQKSSKVTDECTIVINGRNTTDYQAFRQGVNYRAYSNVRVTDVTTDASGKVTRIKVTATESKDTE